MSYVVTGATGHLGRLAIQSLLAKGVPASEIIGLGRQVEKVADLGVTLKKVDYDDPASLKDAFAAGDKVLFISASEAGKRVPQHRNVIEAAKNAGVALIVYTSAPKADTTDMLLAGEHTATEQLLAESGLPTVVLRNGWYVENYLSEQNLANGLVGASGEGRISVAPRSDFAEAAAAALVGDGHVGKVYELGGEALTQAELAAEISRQTGRTVTYTDLPGEKYLELLVGAGLPEPVAKIFADVDRAASQGALEVPKNDIEHLLGRPVTPPATAIRAALS